MTKDFLIERMARAMADNRFNERLKVIRASRTTKRPISYPGPFDGMDYLISAEMWDAGNGLGDTQEPYRSDARAAYAALLELVHLPREN